MTKKDDNEPKIQEAVSKSLKSLSPGKQARRSRKVRFADQLTEQRIYDRTASPNAETTIVAKKITPFNAHSELHQLEPPLSLVASLDLAARKFNATDDVPQATSPTLTNGSAQTTAHGPATAATNTSSKVTKQFAAVTKTSVPVSHAATSTPPGVRIKDDQTLKATKSSKSVKTIVRPTSPRGTKDKQADLKKKAKN